MADYSSYEEYLKTPTFRAARAVALKLANGRCARCEGVATQVHHHQPKSVRYPPWGTWDVPSNLEAICHDCHCKEHKVEHYAKSTDYRIER